MLPTRFRFIWPNSCRGEDLKQQANQKQEWPVAATFVNGSKLNEHSLQRTFYRSFIPSFGSFDYAVSEDKSFKNRPIRNNNYLWRPCLLMDRDKMCKPYRGPSIDASYQVTVHLAEQFQRRLFRNQPIRNKNCLWRPCLLTNRNEMNNLYRGHSIDASHQVSVHLVWRFQRRRFF